MPAPEFSLDTFIPAQPMVSLDSLLDSHIDSAADGGVPWHEPGYAGKIDYRIRQLSYSSLLTLHTCPRKFELYKKRTTQRTEESTKTTITFSFGHVVGDGIQKVLEGYSEQQVIWAMFLGWHTDLANVDDKMKKSFWTAVIAIQSFISMRESGFLKEYELVYYNGRPATELDFCINLPDGFRLRGSVDAVLRNRSTGRIIVLECKTTGSNTINPATYKNSSQAIGYSVVLDVLFPDISSYEVLYLIYQTGTREFNPIPFAKSYLQRALWIKELLLDVEMIKLYEDAGIYPMHGESCVTFGRDCEYFQTCTLNTEMLTKPCTPAEEDAKEYQINLGLIDLLEAQLSKATTETEE